MIKLTSKNVLITGAAGLLGNQFCNALVKAGAKCYLIDINKKKLEKSYRRKKNIFKYALDLTNFTDIKNFKKELDRKRIFIDTIINNAAYNPEPNRENNIVWEKDLELSLTSIKNLIELFSKNMKKIKRQYN